MPSPMSGVQPPYTLPSNIVYFHDWRYVEGGQLRWRDDAGQPVNLMPAPDPLPSMQANWDLVPHGIRIELVPGHVDAEPVLTATELNEKLFVGGSVLYEDGRYRLFYESARHDVPAGSEASAFHNLSYYKVLRIAESEDGYKWRCPELGIVENSGSTRNNIVFDPGAVGFHGGCVFRDTNPAAPAGERYKAFFLGLPAREALERYRAVRPYDIVPMAAANHPDPQSTVGPALCGAVSPDGLRWELIEEPLVVHFSDTAQACTFNETLGRYIAYVRTWFYTRRTVGRCESEDFCRFTVPEQILWPDGGMAPHETWYTPGYAKMPGAPDYHLMFPVRWSQLDDSFTPYLYSSPDGLIWSQIPGGPAAPHGPLGSWCQSGFGMTHLVPLPGERFGSLVGGLHVPHKYPRQLPFGQVGWVSWQRGRLTALRAERDGRFALHPLRFRGRHIVLNYRAKMGGGIQVSVEGVEGRSFANCDVIAGDKLRHVVTWRGESDIGHAEGEAVQLRFQMNNADLFSVSFE